MNYRKSVSYKLVLLLFSILITPAFGFEYDFGDVNDLHIQWSQPPIEIDPNINTPPVFSGYGEPARSTHNSDYRRQWRMDADDFHSLGSIPVTQIRWWGSYKGWGEPNIPNLQPQAWHICFWANQVEGLEPNEIYPERIVWAQEIRPERISYKPLGLTQLPDKSSDMCYVYELTLEPNEWFCPGDFTSNEDIFWISITAIYPSDIEQINLWGWTTRPHIWGNGAVMPAIMGDWPTYDERLFPGRIYPIENLNLCGQNQPMDMCFELNTNQAWIKCDQSFPGIRTSLGYVENLSIAIEPNEGEISLLQQITDDWISDSNEPVIAIGWNGFYDGYVYNPYDCNDINKPVKPEYFLLTICTNNESEAEIDFNHPGELIWEYKAYDYDEVLIGYNKYLFDEPNDSEPLPALYYEPNETVFRYSVRLPSQECFVPEDVNNNYWLTITAVYEEPARDISYPWGWLDIGNVTNNPALQINYATLPEPEWELLTDSEGHLHDMSFILYTGKDPNVPEL
ncbi:MAG: hypothetical protein JXA96_05505 [Sedimentisphaerales bacterium]|nr:hypothetical protein [Sedimentisphaerales bacterium]